MKNLFLTLILTSTFLFARPCMTDIYTGNGINNTDSQAFDNMFALQNFMLYKARTNSRLDIQKYKVDYDFTYIHNPTYGFNNDMMETYYQLKESEQISDGYFHTMFSMLAGNIPESTLHEKIIDIISTYEEDVNSIYNKYYTSSFLQNHNVILVAHSQGNLIGNKVYTLLSETEKKKFRMISVATPADRVMKPGQTSPYVTAHADLVINNPFIPNHLPTNVAGTGHNFIHTYLDEHSEARHLIASYVKNAYDDLMNTFCPCTGQKYTEPIEMTNGAIDIRLSWTCANNINMDLTMTGPRDIVKQDIKDIANLGLEHAYVESQYQLLPGDLFKLSAKGNKLEESNLEESF